MSDRKILLVPTGPGYTKSSYTSPEIKKITSTYATDYLILTGHKFNLVGDGTSILNKTNIRNSALSSSFTSGNRTAILSALDGEIDTYDGIAGQTIAAWVTSAMYLANQICKEQTSAQIWIGLPMFLGSAQPVASLYQECYYKKIMLKVQELAGKAPYANVSWANNIAGFYFGQEDLHPYYTPFTKNSPSNNFGNPVVSCMSYLAGKAKTELGKKFMWIPYYNPKGTDPSTDSGIRVAYIANQTTIFDYIILQPTYFIASSNQQNLYMIRDSVRKQQATYSNSLVGYSTLLKSGRAELGPEMEFFNKYWNNELKKEVLVDHATADLRYDEYVTAYKEFILGKDASGITVTRRPVGFYAGGPDEIIDDTILQMVAKFFKSGKGIYETID